MKYVITWNERSQGSSMEYENTQKRILEVFTQWKAPDNFKIEMFVIRVGDWGGYMLLDCDDQLAVHKFSLSGSNSKRLPFAMDSNTRGSRHIHLVGTSDTSVVHADQESGTQSECRFLFYFC